MVDSPKVNRYKEKLAERRGKIKARPGAQRGVLERTARSKKK